jgi:hypothetical protein
MTWFAAHVIMYIAFKDGRQDTYRVWENVVLVESLGSALGSLALECPWVGEPLSTFWPLRSRNMLPKWTRR